MLGKRASFEWQVGNSENWDDFDPIESVSDVEAVSETAAPQAGRRWQGLKRVLRGLLIVIVLTGAVAGYGFWREYEAGMRRVRTDIQGTIDAEAWAWQNHKDAVNEGLIADSADRSWVHWLAWNQQWYRRWAGDHAQQPAFEIESIELRDDLALVEVVATQPGEPWMREPYREIRFYRQVDRQWLRTSPQPEFWGAERTADTDYFHFEFYQRDAAALATTIETIDELYAGLRRDVGVGLPPADEKLTIKVVPSTDVTSWHFTGDTLRISSPDLLQVPAEVSDAARLTASIAYPLTRRVVDQALRETRIDSQWGPLVDGMRHWLAGEDNPLPSAWRWYVKGLLKQRLRRASTVHLTHFVTPHWASLDQGERWVRILAGESVVDYAVEVYGRDRLPALLRELSEHETWDTLVPTVFDVPLEEFEAGWRLYLADRFGSNLQQATNSSPPLAD